MTIENDTNIDPSEHSSDAEQHVATRRERKKLATRNALAQAALDLIQQKGLHHVTIEDIAEAADVSNRTFFNYFPSKEDVFCGDINDLGRAIADDITASAEGNRTPFELLSTSILQKIADNSENHDVKRQLLRSKIAIIQKEPQLLLAFSAATIKGEKEVYNALKAKFSKIDTEITHSHQIYLATLVTSTFATMRAVMMLWVTREDSPPLEDMIRQALSHLGNGLAPNELDSSENKSIH